jgi:hypothetical protein
MVEEVIGLVLGWPSRCVYDKYHYVSTVKHNSFIFYYNFKKFLQEQYVSTQLRGHHQAGIVTKLKMAIHEHLAYGNS